ncbi:MAG: ABC transporter permease [Alteromonadaceae bacterium]|nr:MAG: ABC transporter permease [Alteromonadaceae bacterium]
MRLALRLLFRDGRSGKLNILWVSLLLAIATVTSISLFTNRIQHSLYDEASHLLAADISISGTLPIPEEWRQRAQEQPLESANFIAFRAMVFSEEGMQLSQVKAVSDTYPLKGELSISDQPYIASQKVKHGPPPGVAWVAPRLFDALTVSTGGNITIGEAEFSIGASLNKEPDNRSGLFGGSPRVMIHLDDVPRTQAVQVGSRIDYHWLLAADNSEIATFSEWLEPQLGEHHRLTNIDSANRSFQNTMARARGFLLLAGCLSVILSAVAIALAARRYSKGQQTQVALLKTLGKTPRDITLIYIVQLLTIGLITLVIGSALGWLLHELLLRLLTGFMPQGLSKASLSAYWVGGVTGFVSLWAFAAPPLLALRKTSPGSILREQSSSALHAGWSFFIGFMATISLVYFYSQDIKLTLILTFGALACVLGVGLISSLLIIVINAILKRTQTIKNDGSLSLQLPPQIKLGLTNLQRHHKFNVLQIMNFSILFLLLLVILTASTRLLDQWRDQLPPETANHFAFNIYPDDIEAVSAMLSDADVKFSPFYPMTRGRVSKVNEDTLSDRVKQHKGRANYRRELNLTWSNQLGSDNKIKSGQWWQEGEKTEKLMVSAEHEYAEGLGISVGDTLTFSIAGQTVSAEVASLRKVQWDSMNPNFYMVFNQAPLDGATGNWLTSFYLAPENKNFLNQLARTFPTVSLIEIDQTIKQIQEVISKISRAIEFIMVLILGSGLLVLISSIQSTLDLRFQESAILRTLGASRSLVRDSLLVEFCTMGLLAGLLASVGAELSMYFLQTNIFNLQYVINGWAFVYGPLSASLLIGFTGWMSTRKVIHTPPLHVLREV